MMLWIFFGMLIFFALALIMIFLLKDSGTAKSPRLHMFHVESNGEFRFFRLNRKKGIQARGNGFKAWIQGVKKSPVSISSYRSVTFPNVDVIFSSEFDARFELDASKSLNGLRVSLAKERAHRSKAEGEVLALKANFEERMNSLFERMTKNHQKLYAPYMDLKGRGDSR